MKKKSQIQIGETIAVLFVFFILVVIGFIFYSKIIRGTIEVEKDELSQLQSIGVAQKIMFLPELQCSEDGIIIDNCIDLAKLRAVTENKLMKSDLYYFDLLEFSDVSVLQIYPQEPVLCGTSRACAPYSKPLTDFKNKFETNVPIDLYDSSAKKHSFGLMTITTYTK